MCDDEKSEGYQDSAMIRQETRWVNQIPDLLGTIVTWNLLNTSLFNNIVTNTGIPFLDQNQKSDYSIDLVIIGSSFLSKDALMKERLSILLSSTKEEAEKIRNVQLPQSLKHH